MANDKRPVVDEGEPYRPVPYRAGGPQSGLAERKTELLSAGPGAGFLPGRRGAGRRSWARSGCVHDAENRALHRSRRLPEP